MTYGFQTEASYPYTSKNGAKGACKYDAASVVFTPNDAFKIKYNDPAAM